MIIKKREWKSPWKILFDFISKRQTKIIALIILFLLLSGFLFGMIFTGFFGTLDKPSANAANLLRKISLFTPSQYIFRFVKYSLHPINFIKGQVSDPEVIYLDIKFEDFQKLRDKKNEAVKIGNLFSSDEDFVPAQIRYNNDVIKVKIRLKGDLADHWGDEKLWSFRVAIREDKTIFGMKKFSLQRPSTRDYLNEWYLHKFVEYFGLPALRYDFVHLYVNGDNLGIYAIEEHFGKELIEHNELREGLVIRFDDMLCWYKDHLLGCDEIYTTSPIETFSLGSIQDDEVLMNQFNKARNLLEGFRRRELKTSQVFDIKKVAKLFAVGDLFGYSHFLAYANMRIYYNPVTSKLELIAYDNQAITELSTSYGLIGAGKKIEGEIGLLDDNFFTDNFFFSDKEFFTEYINALEEISDKRYLDEFFANVDEEADEKLDILHKTYPAYSFEYKPVLYNNQEYIRYMLNPIKAVQVYTDEINENILTLQIGNIHVLPIEIVDVNAGDTVLKPTGNILLEAKSHLENVDFREYGFVIPTGFKLNKTSEMKINYKILGTEQIKSELVYPWKFYSLDYFDNDVLRKESNFKDFNFLTVDETRKSIFFKKGKWELNETLILPKGYTIFAQGGTTIDLKNSANIISYSPLRFIGTPEEFVEITSSDKTGQGLVLLNAGNESIFSYVLINGLSFPKQNDWELTGAVTFYESPMKIDHTFILNTKSEDALNIIRSEFDIENLVIRDTTSDCLDIDFGKGKIKNSQFANCVNDAMDFSGSYADISDVTITNVGDKGISSGEKSNVDVYNIKVNGAKIAAASKDLSVLNVDGMEIKSSQYGFALYKKKPEFGPAELKAINVFDNVKNNIVEKGSTLVLNSETIKGNSKNVYDLLYGVSE